MQVVRMTWYIYHDFVEGLTGKPNFIDKKTHLWKSANLTNNLNWLVEYLSAQNDPRPVNLP